MILRGYAESTPIYRRSQSPFQPAFLAALSEALILPRHRLSLSCRRISTYQGGDQAFFSRQAMIFLMLGGSRIRAMTSILPPQSGQRHMSTSYTFFNSRARANRSTIRIAELRSARGLFASQADDAQHPVRFRRIVLLPLPRPAVPMGRGAGLQRRPCANLFAIRNAELRSARDGAGEYARSRGR